MRNTRLDSELISKTYDHIFVQVSGIAKLRAKNGDNGYAKQLEYDLIPFFEEIFKKEFQSTEPDQDVYDLYAIDKSIAIQISIDKRSEKIRNTVVDFHKKNYHKEFERLIIFFAVPAYNPRIKDKDLIGNIKSFGHKWNIDQYSFNVKEDCLDFAWLGRQIRNPKVNRFKIENAIERFGFHVDTSHTKEFLQNLDHKSLYDDENLKCWKDVIEKTWAIFKPLSILPRFIFSEMKLEEERMAQSVNEFTLSTRSKSFVEELKAENERPSKQRIIHQFLSVHWIKYVYCWEVGSFEIEKSEHGIKCEVCEMHDWGFNFQKRTEGDSEYSDFQNAYFHYLFRENYQAYTQISKYLKRDDFLGVIAHRNLKRLSIWEKNIKDDSLDQDKRRFLIGRESYSKEERFVLDFIESNSHWKIQDEILKASRKCRELRHNYCVYNHKALLNELGKINFEIHFIFRFTSHNFLFKDLEYSNVSYLFIEALNLWLESIRFIDNPKRLSIECSDLYPYLLTISSYEFEKMLSRYSGQFCEVSVFTEFIIKKLENLSINISAIYSRVESFSAVSRSVENFLSNTVTMMRYIKLNGSEIEIIVKKIIDLIKLEKNSLSLVTRYLRKTLIYYQMELDTNTFKQYDQLVAKSKKRIEPLIIGRKSIYNRKEILKNKKEYSVFQLHDFALNGTISRQQAKSIITERIDNKFDFHSCRLGVLFGYLDFSDYEDIILNDLQKLLDDYSSRSDDYMKSLVWSKLQGFISISYECNLDLSSQKYFSLCPNEDYFKWLFDIENFDYDHFDPLWILEYPCDSFKKKFKQSAKLKEYLEIYLKNSVNSDISKFYFNTFLETEPKSND